MPYMHIIRQTEKKWITTCTHLLIQKVTTYYIYCDEIHRKNRAFATDIEGKWVMWQKYRQDIKKTWITWRRHTQSSVWSLVWVFLHFTHKPDTFTFWFTPNNSFCIWWKCPLTHVIFIIIYCTWKLTSVST